MTPLEAFQAQLKDFATNNITALEGIWQQLPGEQRAAGKQLAQGRSIDVTKWV